jgi:hypothetical protein
VDVRSTKKKLVNNSEVLKNKDVLDLSSNSEKEIEQIVKKRLKEVELGNYELYSDLAEARRRVKRRQLK